MSPIMKKDLDAWFKQLTLKELAGIFYWEDGWSENVFIENCNEYWLTASDSEKEWFYGKYSS